MRALCRNSLLGLSIAAVSGTALAAEWTFDPEVSLKGGYNDNIRFRADDEVSSPVVTLSPSTLFSVATPSAGASGKVKFDFRRFTQESNLDDNNWRVDLASFKDLERSSLGLDLDFIKDTTLDSQLTDTGFVGDRIDRFSAVLSPHWTYNLTERTNTRLTYLYRDVDYKDSDGTGFVDFTTHLGELSLNHALSERAIVSISARVATSDSDNNVDNELYSLQAGGNYRFSETLFSSLSIGVRKTKTTFKGNSQVPIFSNGVIIGFVTVPFTSSNNDLGGVFEASLTKQFLRGSTELAASQDVRNSGTGSLIQVTRLDWRNDYNLSETLSADLDFQFRRTRDTNSVNTGLDRTFYRVEPRLNWHFREFWRISASYRYSLQDFDNSNGDAKQNAAYLTLTYLWPRIAVSR